MKARLTTTALTSTALAGVFLLWATAPAFSQMPLPDAAATAGQPQQTGVPDVAARSEIIYRANLGRAEDVKLLINQGGSPNQMNGEGVPILSLAAGRRDAEGKNVVATLIQMGADIGARDRKGQNAMFYAARSGAVESTNVLMENKIDIYAIDNEGNTARSIAFNTGHKDVVQAIDTFISKPLVTTPPPVALVPTPAASMYPPPLVPTPPPALIPTPGAAITPALVPNPAGAPATLTNVVPLLPAPATAPAPDAAATAAAAAAAAEQEATKEHQKILEQELADLKKNLPTREDIKKMAEELSATNRKAQEEEANKRALKKKYSEDGASENAASATTKRPLTDEERQQEEEKRTQQIEHMNTDLAFNTCGYQYWYFCNDVKQGTELDSEELTIAIASYKTKSENIKNTLIKKFNLREEQFSSVIDSAQQRIYNQLRALSSNQNRHENGIGKMDDMLARCGEIGRQWQVEVPGIITPESGGSVPGNPPIDPQNINGNGNKNNKGGGGGKNNMKHDGAPMPDNGGNGTPPDNAHHTSNDSGQPSNNQNVLVTTSGGGKNGQKHGPITPPLQGGSGEDSVFK